MFSDKRWRTGRQWKLIYPYNPKFTLVTFVVAAHMAIASRCFIRVTTGYGIFAHTCPTIR
jgi:hypothetical protein